MMSQENNEDEVDLKVSVDDDTYTNLKASLLHSGKGRPKALKKDIVLNNRLLVQLSFLREEGDKPLLIIDKWLPLIHPNLQELAGSQTRYINLVEATRKRAQLLCASERYNFLELPVNFLFISECLGNVGIDRKTINFPPENITPVRITNRVVRDLDSLVKTENISRKIILDWIHKFTGCVKSKLPYAVERVNKTYNKLLRSARGNKTLIEEYLDTSFQVSLESAAKEQTVTCDLDLNSTSTPVKKPVHCTKCDENKLIISSLRSSLTDVQEYKDQVLTKIASLEKERELDQIKKQNSDKDFLEEIKKLKETLEFERGETAALRKKFNSLEKELKKKTKFNEDLKSKQIEKRRQYLTLQKLLKDTVKEYENKLFKAESIIEESASFNVSLKEKEKNAYTNDVRKVVIALQCLACVSASNVSTTIQIVSEYLFHYTFSDDLPCKQTCINMCDEGFFISNVQAAESVLNSSNCTLHSDGTSRDRKSVVGHQLTVDNGDTLWLGFTPVACEDSNTLLDIVYAVLKKMATCYGFVSHEESETLVKRILCKISSSMTDRAACMKLFDKKFEMFLQSEIGESVKLNFLHCSAHFLLGLSSGSEKCLAAFEHELGNSGLGRDKCGKFSHFKKGEESATSRIIRMLCEVLGPRGDQKNGCREDWITFCSDSIIPSFKSNRFNCFFEAAAACIFHHEKITLFFKSGVLPEAINLKIQSVAMDIDDALLMCLVCSIALLYLKVTGPYWKVINSSVKYHEFHVYVQKMYDSFCSLSADPNEFLSPSFKSVFGNEFTINSKTWEAVHHFVLNCDNSVLKSILKALFNELSAVTKRQLGEDFLTGGRFTDVPDSVKEQIDHCPLTNLVGESAFGDFDYDLSKRRNASLHNRSAHHCIKRNNTCQYINKQPLQQQNNLFQIARKQGSWLRKENKSQEDNVKDAIRSKFVSNQQKRIEKELQEIGRNANIVEAVKVHSGPCLSSKEVENLICSLEEQDKSVNHITNVIKNEIRYHKLIHKRKLKFGTLSFMVGSLKRALDSNAPDDVQPGKRPRL